jgi:hypothetical protein
MALSCRGGAVHSNITALQKKSGEVGPPVRMQEYVDVEADANAVYTKLGWEFAFKRRE